MYNSLFAVILILMQMASFLYKDVNYAFFVLALVFLFSVYYCVQKVSVRAPLLAFDISFFILLLSRLFIPYFYNIDRLTYQSQFVIIDSLLFETYTQLSIALLSITSVYLFTAKENKQEVFNLEQTSSVLSLRKCAKVLSLVLSVFFIIQTFSDIVNNFTYGYGSLYDGTSTASVFMTFTAGKFNFCMYLYFATMPSKKECKPMLSLYFLCNLLTIFTGQRNAAILPLIFFVLYLAIRNKINSNGEIWLSKKLFVLFMLASPLIMYSMYLIMIIRGGNTHTNLNPVDGILSSIYQLGSSIEVIQNTILYENNLHEQFGYSLSEFYNFLIHNPVSSFFMNVPHYSMGSIGLATDGKSLGASLTYLDNSIRYFNFGSVGSSYVSEAWIDFGYIGIIIFSSLYGYILSSIWKWFNKNVWIIFAVFIFLVQIIYAPRSSASSFFVDLIETKSWPYLAVAYYCYKHPK